MEDSTTKDAIEHLLPEIEETRQKLKTLRAQLKDMLEQNEEYQALAEEIKELANKRLEAKKLLLSDQAYQQLNAEVDDYKNKLKDLQEIMSHHLVTYYNETNKTEIETAHGETRPVILSAKIGKPEIKVEPAGPPIALEPQVG